MECNHMYEYDKNLETYICVSCTQLSPDGYLIPPKSNLEKTSKLQDYVLQKIRKIPNIRQEHQNILIEKMVRFINDNEASLGLSNIRSERKDLFYAYIAFLLLVYDMMIPCDTEPIERAFYRTSKCQEKHAKIPHISELAGKNRRKKRKENVKSPDEFFDITKPFHVVQFHYAQEIFGIPDKDLLFLKGEVFEKFIEQTLLAKRRAINCVPPIVALYLIHKQKNKTIDDLDWIHKEITLKDENETCKENYYHLLAYMLQYIDNADVILSFYGKRCNKIRNLMIKQEVEPTPEMRRIAEFFFS